MKKLTSILLSATMLLSASTLVNANYIEGGEDIIQGDIMLINETDETMPIAEGTELEVPQYNVPKMTTTGTVVAVSENQIELDSYTLNISDYTFLGDYNFNPIEEVKVGDEVTAIISMAQTMSIPPQSYAFYVLVKTEEAQNAPFFATVESVDGEFINTANYQITYKDVETSMFKVRSIIMPQDITPGSEIAFYTDMMTMSIPAQTNPSKIVVLDLAGEVEVSYLQENGILLGTENGLELTREVTRAEAVTFLSRISVAARATTDLAATFEDVTESHWAYNTINWAHNAGIIEGVGDGKFAPNATVSGKQFVKMLLSMKGDTEVTIENAYEKGIEAGIITYSVDAQVSNDAELTRNDVSILLYNAIEK